MNFEGLRCAPHPRYGLPPLRGSDGGSGFVFEGLRCAPPPSLWSAASARLFWADGVCIFEGLRCAHCTPSLSFLRLCEAILGGWGFA